MENFKLIGITSAPYHIKVSSLVDEWEHNKSIETTSYIKSYRLYHRDSNNLIGVYYFAMNRGFNDNHIFVQSQFVLLSPEDKYIVCRLDESKFVDVDFSIGDETRLKNLQCFDESSWRWAIRCVQSWAGRIYVAPENFIEGDTHG